MIAGPPFSGVTTTTRAVMRTVDVYLYSCFSLADLGGPPKGPADDCYAEDRDNYIDISSLPFQIPLGALIPERVENLLPACKNIGTTHIGKSPAIPPPI